MKNSPAMCLRALVPCLLLAMLLLQSASVRAQQAIFTYTATPASQCAPVTLTFQNTSTGNPVAYNWDFGDGRTSHATAPQITYTNSGTYRVTLVAQYTNGSSTVWKEVIVGSTPAVTFSANITSHCKAYNPVFTDATPGGISRTWDFGDGTAAVTTTAMTVPHSYTREGAFDVTLSVTNSEGCTQTLTQKAMINIAYPVVEMSAPTAGCVPLTAALNANATNIINDPVSAYTWNFGDNKTATTSIPTTTHLYSNTGTYDVTLTATTQQGCIVTRTFDNQVQAGNPPTQVSFTASPLITCAGDPVRMLATASNANTYRWDFGDGTTEETTENDIRHTFSDNGILTINMQAGNNGCYTTSAPVAVEVNGPVARFSFVRSCNNKNQFTFTNTSKGITANTIYEWDFGDESPLENTRDATHTYTQPGNYTVRLTIKENGTACNSTALNSLYAFTASFDNGVKTICRGTEITYKVLNVPAVLVAEYIWTFGDGTVVHTQQPDYPKRWDITGSYADQLEIRYKDVAYCTDVITKPDRVEVIAPIANFSLVHNACANQPVTFNNTSQTSPNIPFTNWKWELGNEITSSVQIPLPTSYSSSGDYLVKLIVTDARNCMDSITQPITVRPTPFVHASTQDDMICEGNRTTLHALTDAAIQWLNSSDISCSSCISPQVWPVTDTRYKVQATNVYGCSVMDSVDLKVVPKVHLTVRTDTAVCKGSSVQLSAAGAKNYSWTPVDFLTNNLIANPITTPEEDMVYTVTGSNDPACPSESLPVRVSVKNLPTVSAGLPQLITVGSTVKLNTTYSMDVIKWDWYPTDYLDCPTCPSVNAAVRKPISYSVTVTNTEGCTRSAVVDVDLICSHDVVFIPNTFSPNGDGQNDIFYPRGKGINFIKSFRIFNRWGQEVFRREKFNIDDISAGWNGTYKGVAQPADVYIYFLEAFCDTQEFFQLQGNVTLLR
jgi:gliding motility-associated-like protein